MATDEATSGGVVVRLQRSAKETLTTAGILSTEDVV
jgi:hypothetical protein